MEKIEIFSGDVGNAKVKASSLTAFESFPHALRALTAHDIAELKMRDELDNTEGVYNVNGKWYQAGEQALRRSETIYGEARYTAEYYGVLAAIAMWRTLPESSKNLYYAGSHTPKDAIYKTELADAVRGTWNVSSQGVEKQFKVKEVRTFDEPVAAYRHAMLSDDCKSTRGEKFLTKGAVLVIDIGGFTVGIAKVSDGKVDYMNARTSVGGVIEVLQSLEQLIRQSYKTALRGANSLDPARLAIALQTGEYDAKGAGVLNVKQQVNEACIPLLNSVMNLYDSMNGNTDYDGVLLAGGGGALLESRLRKAINRGTIAVAEQKREEMQFAAARGMMKLMRIALRAKGIAV